MKGPCSDGQISLHTHRVLSRASMDSSKSVDTREAEIDRVFHNASIHHKGNKSNSKDTYADPQGIGQTKKFSAIEKPRYTTYVDVLAEDDF